MTNAGLASQVLRWLHIQMRVRMLSDVREFCINFARSNVLTLVGLACACSLIAGPVYAQIDQVGAPIISNFDAKVYKAHSQNWAAIQDKRGLMYFGNSQGILEYDGQH